MRTYRFEIKPLNAAASEDVRWNHIVAWRFSDAAFVVPMGYAVPDDHKHIRLPEGSKQEGVRDLHCTLLIAGNSVRVDMAADAQVFINGVAVDDLSWILRAGERCNLRLGQPRGNEDINPTFQVSLYRDSYELPKDPAQRKAIQARMKRGGSIGVANQLWKWRGLRRVAFGVLAGGLAVAAVASLLLYIGQADLRAQQQAMRAEVEATLKGIEQASRFTLDQVRSNPDAIRNAIKPVVLVTMKAGKPDFDTLQGIGTAWRCCAGGSDPNVWITNQHVVDQLIAAKATFGSPAPAEPGSPQTRDAPDQSSWEQRAFIFAGPGNVLSFQPGLPHPDFASMRIIQEGRSRYLKERSLGTGSERDDTVNPFDVVTLVPNDAGASLQITPLALAPPEVIEAVTQIGQPSLAIGFPFEGPRNTRFNVQSPEHTVESGYITHQMGPARIRSSDYKNNLVLLLDGIPLGGASGSPVIDRDGRVIAITGEGVTTTIQQTFVGADESGERVVQSQPVRVSAGKASVFAYRVDVIHELLAPDAEKETQGPERRERLRLIESQAYATDPRQADLDDAFAKFAPGCPQASRQDWSASGANKTGRTSQRIEIPAARFTGPRAESFWFGVQPIDTAAKSADGAVHPDPAHRVLVRLWSEENEPKPLSLLRYGVQAPDRSALDGSQSGGSIILDPSPSSADPRQVTVISREGEQSYGLEAIEFWCAAPDGGNPR